MGSASSTLSKAQKEEMMKVMKASLENCSKDGLDDDLTQETLMKEYDKMAKKFSRGSFSDAVDSDGLTESKKVVSVTKFEPPQARKATKPATTAAAAKGKQKATRRRSFDVANKDTQKKKDAMEAAIRAAQKSLDDAAKAMHESQSAPVIASTPDAAAVEEVVDSWDSVTQQPFCTVCQMAFKSITFLERHTKYSELHIKNAKRKELEAAETAEENKVVSEEAKAIEDAETKKAEEIKMLAEAEARAAERLASQEEGKHFKPLYNGSKFFWRTQKTVDVDMYLHILPMVVEVISFDPDKHRELSRIYLQYTTIADILEQMIVMDMEAKKKELRQDRFYTAPDELELRDTITKNRVITHILQRLQMDTVNETGNLVYVQLSGDMKSITPVVDKPPSVIIPVSMTRRRRTNAEDIAQTMINIEKDRMGADELVKKARSLSNNKEMLDAARKKAQRIAQHVYDSANFIRAKKWYSKFPLPKRRFIRAVYDIIRRNQVLKLRSWLYSKYPELPTSAKQKAYIERGGGEQSTAAA